MTVRVCYKREDEYARDTGSDARVWVYVDGWVGVLVFISACFGALK